MLSDGVLKNEFVRRILTRDQAFILAEQHRRVATYYKRRTGRLLESLNSHPIAATFNTDNAKMIIDYPIYIRFLDIKNKINKGKKDAQLYDRVLWGVIYNETLKDLRIGTYTEIADDVKNELLNISKNG